MSTSVDVFYFRSGQGQYTVHIFSMERQKALGLGLNLKYLKLCSDDE